MHKKKQIQNQTSKHLWEMDLSSIQQQKYAFLWEGARAIIYLLCINVNSVIRALGNYCKNYNMQEDASFFFF